MQILWHRKTPALRYLRPVLADGVAVPRVSRPRTDLVNLFDDQAMIEGGWMVADVAGCAAWPGITRPGVAGCGWAAVAVGSQ
jgi:hypothetical protein